MVSAWEILTYSGNVTDIELNYVALVICLAAYISIFYFLPEYFSTWRRYIWIPVLVFLYIFQVNLSYFHYSDDSLLNSTASIWKDRAMFSRPMHWYIRNLECT